MGKDKHSVQVRNDMKKLIGLSHVLDILNLKQMDAIAVEYGVGLAIGPYCEEDDVMDV